MAVPSPSLLSSHCTSIRGTGQKGENDSSYDARGMSPQAMMFE